MTMGERDIEVLAELNGHPSFVLLMKIFRDFEDGVLEELSLERSSEGLLRIAKFYQTMRAIRSFLESQPQQAAETLSRIKGQYFDLLADEMPVDVVQARFNPVIPPDATKGL